MKILHTIPYLDVEAGGPVQVATYLTDLLSQDPQISVTLISQGLRSSNIIPLSSNSQVLRVIGCSNNRLFIALGVPVYKKLQEQKRACYPELIHIHGLWHLANHWSAQTAIKNRIPFVFHTHGMLDKWSLQHRQLKKKVGLWLYQNSDLQSANLFFATAQKEAENIRDFGLRQPIAIVPNGIFMPSNTNQFTSKSSSNKRNFLFLGRIHPVKGLINLIEAWSLVKPVNSKLTIAGPDEGNHLQEIERKIEELGLQRSVKTINSVEGEEKQKLFINTDVFILPSFTENFGVVVAEALSYGIPVITTTGTPWSDLRDYQCGWWVSPTVAAIAEALNEATSLPPGVLQTMGEKGREYVRRYDWNIIAQDTLAVYQWILGQGPKPDCVTCD